MKKQNSLNSANTITLIMCIVFGISTIIVAIIKHHILMATAIISLPISILMTKGYCILEDKIKKFIKNKNK